MAEFVLSPLEGDTPRYHSGTWREVFAQQTLFQPYAETTIIQQQHGSVEQVGIQAAALRLVLLQPCLNSSRHTDLKQQFEQIIQQYTAKSAEEMIDFPYVTHIYVFKKSN